MKIYLAKKYCLFSFIVSGSIMTLGTIAGGVFTSVLEMLLKSFFMGALIGLLITYLYFGSLGLWILYDNLRINRYIQLVISFFSFLLVSFLFSFVINAMYYGL